MFNSRESIVDGLFRLIVVCLLVMILWNSAEVIQVLKNSPVQITVAQTEQPTISAEDVIRVLRAREQCYVKLKLLDSTPASLDSLCPVPISFR